MTAQWSPEEPHEMLESCRQAAKQQSAVKLPLRLRGPWRDLSLAGDGSMSADYSCSQGGKIRIGGLGNVGGGYAPCQQGDAPATAPPAGGVLGLK